MRIRQFAQWSTQPGTPFWKAYFVFGLCLVLFGILVIIKPELLVALIGGGFIFLGIIVLGIAMRLKRLDRALNTAQRSPFRES